MKTKEMVNGSTVVEFANLVKQGVECWQKAGEIVTKQIESDPGWVDAAAEKTGLSIEAIMMFDRIGRRQLHPELILSDAPGVVALRRMPFAIQERHVGDPVDVLVHTASGWESLRVDVRNLTKTQAAMVFDKTGIRSLPAQRAWVESKAAADAAKTVDDGTSFRVVGGQLVVMKPCKFSRVELARMLVEMA